MTLGDGEEALGVRYSEPAATVPSLLAPLRTGILLHVHSCETVLRISGVTLGVLGLGVLAMRATRNPISLLLGLKPHTQKTKNEKKRSGSPSPPCSSANEALVRSPAAMETT